MIRARKILAEAIEQLEKTSSIPASTPDNGHCADKNVHKAIIITAAASVLHSVYPHLDESPEIERTLIENGLRDRIDKRILRITMYDVPYPTAEEILDACKVMLEVIEARC